MRSWARQQSLAVPHFDADFSRQHRRYPELVVAVLVMIFACSRDVGADPLLSVAPLEAERIHPSLDVELPEFPTKPDTKRFFIFNYHLPHGQPEKVLYLDVPYEFAGTDAREPERAWGLPLIVHYPEMTGVFNPTNKGKIGDCAGGCAGDKLIVIYNEVGSISSGPQLAAAALERDRHNPALAYTEYAEASSDNFSEVVSETHGSNPRNTSNSIYYTSGPKG